MKDVLINDGYANMTAGLATSKDKASGGRYVMSTTSRQQFHAAYKTSWLAKRIIDLPARDETRRWRSWSGDSTDITAIEKEEKRLGLQQKVYMARQRARLDGVAAIYMSTDDVSAGTALGDQTNTQHSMPLDVETISVGGIRRLSVLTRSQLWPGDEIDTDPDSEFYGEAAYYVLKTGTGTIRVHPSRLAIFYGEKFIMDDYTRFTGFGDSWNADSVLQSIFSAVMMTDASTASVASMLFEAKIDVYSIPNLMAMLETSDEYEETIVQRFALANRIKSVNNAVILDSEETHDGKQLTFSGVSEVMEKFFQVISGASGIPVTRLFGRSPSGLNATGESDIRLYYDVIAGNQSNDIDPAMIRLNIALVRSALGKTDDKIFHTWRALWAPNDAEKAKMAKDTVDAGKVLVDMGGNKDIVVPAIMNSMVELEVMPGLEDQIEKVGRDKMVAEDPPPPALAAPGATPAPGGNVVPLRPRTQDVATRDARPRSLYVSRKVLNAGAILQHYADQGVTDLYMPEELHVTIAYSRAELDWMQLPQPFQAELRIPAGGARIHETLGPEGNFHVLLFGAEELRWRWEALKSAGAEWDWPDYQPHISLSRTSSLEGVEPWTRTIVLGPEIWEEVKDD